MIIHRLSTIFLTSADISYKRAPTEVTEATNTGLIYKKWSALDHFFIAINPNWQRYFDDNIKVE